MSNLLLKTIDQLNTQIQEINDKSYGFSFAFYGINNGNVGEFKGTSASTVKRLVGAELMAIIPMKAWKNSKKNDTKKVFQFHKMGALQDECDNAEVTSIAELIGWEPQQAVNQETFELFCAKVHSYFESVKQGKKDEKDVIKEQKEEQKSNFLRANPTASGSDFEAFDKELNALEKALEAFKKADLQDTDTYHILEARIDDKNALASGGVAEPMTTAPHTVH